jgi:NAD(P)-dependent dehydrogenase (short-subunit alcohol dehydrogenase family)
MQAAVTVNYRNDQKAAEATVSDIEKAGGKAVALRADMRQVRDIQLLFERTIDIRWCGYSGQQCRHPALSNHCIGE